MVARNDSDCCIPPVQGVWIMEPWRLDWMPRAWIIGEESSGTLVCLHVCYDCLCLMTLFRAVMLLVPDWAE